MGLLDKVKDTANKAAEKVQQGADLAQDKLEETKQRKKIADLKEELGGVVYDQRTGGTTATATEAEVVRLVGEIQTLETQLADAAAAADGPATDEPGAAS